MNQKITIISAIAVSCTASFILGHAWSGSDEPSLAGQPNRSTGPRAWHGRTEGSSRTGQSSARPSHHSSNGFAQTAHSAPSILSNSDAVARAKTWANFVDRLDAGSFEETANRLLQGGYSESRKHEFSMLMSAWAKQDPLSALAYADQQMQGNDTSLHQAALASWARINPEAAIEYAKNKQSSKYSSPWLLGVIEGLAETDPARANELLAEMPRSHDRYKAVLALQSHYLAQGPEAARNWAMGMEDPSLRRGAIGEIAKALAKTDPKATVDWLMANPDSAPKNAITYALAEMAKADPAAAVTYFSQFESDDATRSHVIGGIASGLTKSDPQAALDFLKANPSPVNDMALLKLAAQTAQTHPEIAATAKDRIQTPEMRSMAENSINSKGGLVAPSSIPYHEFIDTFSDAAVFGAGTAVRISGGDSHGSSIFLMTADSAEDSTEVQWDDSSTPEPEE